MDQVVVGRDGPVEQLEGFIGGVADCAGVRSLLLAGEAGIGKSILWQAAIDSAAKRGYRLLVGRPAESETALAYSGLADLLGPIDGQILNGLPPPQRRALEVALLLAEPDGRPPEPRAIFAAFGRVLAALSRDGPVLVAVDDLQWIDRSSLRALVFVSRRLGDDPVGLLATARLEADGGAGERLDVPGATVLRLKALSPGALHRLIRLRTGVSLPRPTVLRVHRMTRGNPFLALELARVLVASDLPAATEEWPVPEDLREIAAARVGQLPKPIRSALLNAAASGRPAISGLRGSGLRAAEAAGIVAVGPSGTVRFAHPLFASAIYGNASAVERRRVHAALAADAAQVEEQARHRALACRGQDEDVAVLLDRAAASARGRGAPDVAAEFAERAVALTPVDRPDEASQRRVVAADSYFHAGDLERARSLLVELVGLTEPSATPGSHALRLLGEACYRLGELENGLGYLRDAVVAAAGDPALVFPAELDIALAMSQSFRSFEEASAAADRALSAAEALGDVALVATALAASAAADFFFRGRGLDEEKLERALTLEDPDLPSAIDRRPSYLVGLVLVFADELDRARIVLDTLRARLVERGEEGDLPEVLTLLARIACLAGDFPGAAGLADEGYELAVQAGSGSMAAVTRAMRAVVDAHAGRVDETRAAATEAIELAGRSGWQIAWLWAATALGLLELSLGNDAAVVSVLAPSIKLLEERGITEPSRHPYLPDVIEALINLGELDRAERLACFLEERARALNRHTTLLVAARCRALVLAARGDVMLALAGLDTIAGDQNAVQLPLELARTLLVKGQLERRRKQKRPARVSLHRALGIFEEIDAIVWAERTRSELARLGGPREPGLLTATEDRVASLAVSGMTNREIANSAFMSQKTVEANLSRIYRKLGIRSRAELGIRLLAVEAKRTSA